MSLVDLASKKGFSMDFDSIETVERQREGELDKYPGKFAILTVPNGGENAANKSLKISHETCDALGINYTAGKIAIGKKGDYIFFANPLVKEGETVVDEVIEASVFSVKAGAVACTAAWDTLGKHKVAIIYGSLTNEKGQNNSTAKFPMKSGDTVKVPIVVYKVGENVLAEVEGGFKPEHLKAKEEIALANLKKKNEEMKAKKQ